MKPRLILTHLPQLIAAASCAAGVKSFYSAAGVNDLGWVLTPTTFLVELLTRAGFKWESGAGYMSSDHSFLIAASCSGVNFLIAAFLMLAFGWLWKRRSAKAGWLFLPVSLAAAYLVTILANTVRISTAMQIRRIDPELIWLNPDQLHRFEGIVVYFGFLLLLFVAVERMFLDRGEERPGARRRRWLLPLAAYYGTTLGVPLVNGIFRGGLTEAEFLEHAVFVLLIPLVLLALLAGVRFIRDLRPDLRVRQID